MAIDNRSQREAQGVPEVSEEESAGSAKGSAKLREKLVPPENSAQPEKTALREKLAPQAKSVPPAKSAPRGALASLAAELGVSRTTVSNAYNHPRELSPALRRKILAAAEARGYPGPNPTARSLRTRRVGAVGVLLTEQLAYAFEDLASVEFLAGLAQSSYGTANSLTLVPVGSDGSSGVAIARAVVDGFIIYSVAASDPHIDAARGTGLPMVICDQPYDIADLPFVGIDDRAAIAPAVRALTDAGHTRIGVLGKRLTRKRHDGPVTCAQVEAADLHVQRDRILGAVEIIDAARSGGAVQSTGAGKLTGAVRSDIPVPEPTPIVVRHHNDHDAATDAARELLTMHPELTAVVCTTDSMAFGVLDYAHERGIRVPEELSVTGFDGIELALARGLTTVRQPMRAKGATAGKMLDALIRQHLDDRLPPRPVPREILPTTFVPGRTVAPPRVGELQV